MADAASAEETTQKALEQLNLSIEDDTKDLSNGSLLNGVNGKSTPSPRHSGEHSSPDRTIKLEKELERTKQEKEALSTQYQNLVTRLNNMRTTLGNKLKQDAVSSLSLLTTACVPDAQWLLGRARPPGAAHTTANSTER